jgi:hypothetical protein
VKVRRKGCEEKRSKCARFDVTTGKRKCTRIGVKSRRWKCIRIGVKKRKSRRRGIGVNDVEVGENHRKERG